MKPTKESWVCQFSFLFSRYSKVEIGIEIKTERSITSDLGIEHKAVE